MVNEEESFWKRIQFTMYCWNWTGSTNGTYPTIPINGRKSMYAHRWSYQKYVGALVDGLEIDHLCRNQLCVNPMHLEQVTRKVNMERTPKATKTKCSKGHDYNEQNTYIKPNGCRDCRACRRDRDKLRRPAGWRKNSKLRTVRA